MGRGSKSVDRVFLTFIGDSPRDLKFSKTKAAQELL